MRTSWLALGGGLCGFALTSPGTDPVARTLCVCALLAALVLDRRRAILAGACLLGLVSGTRIAPVIDLTGRDPSALVPVAAVLDEPIVEGRSRGWVRVEGFAPVRARMSGLRDLAGGRGTKVAGEARLRDLERRSTPDRRAAGRSAAARRDRLGVTFRQARILEPGATGRRERWLQDLEERLGPSAGLWRALSAADAAALDPRARAVVQRLGMAHLLALSGMHTAIVGAVLLWPWRRHGRRAMVFIVPVLALWVIVAGAGPSLVRAVGMVGWWVVARRCGRRSDVADGLAAVALCELTLRPHMLCGVGWWLSYTATMSVVRVAAATRHWPRLAAAVAVSAGAQGATLPWVLDAFGFVNLAAPLTLLVVGPVFGVALTLGLAGVVLGSFLPALAPWFDGLTVLAGHAFGLVLRLVSPASGIEVRAPGLDGWGWAASVVAVAVVLWPGRPALRVRLAVSAILIILASGRGGPDHEWVVFDVGQGDAAVLRCGDRALVIDTGPNYGDAAPAEWTVVDWLRRRGLSDVSVAITHGHLDHSGGLGVLLASGRVAEIVIAETDVGREWAVRVGRAAGEAGVRLRAVAAGESLEVGHCRPEVLWPPAGGMELHTNDRSLVLRFPVATGRAFSAGDLERPGEARLDPPGEHDWLKVAHHGGNTGTDAGLLESLAPAHALVSCGAGNRYGHPHPAVLERLRLAGARIHRTDLCGFLRVRWTLDQAEATLDCGRPGCP